LGHVFPLVGDGPWGGEQASFFPAFADEIEGMVAPFAVLLAAITGGAFVKHPGILPSDNLHHFAMGLFMTGKREVLALQQAIGGGTGGADLFFPLQGIHKDLLFRFSGQALTLRTTPRRIKPIIFNDLYEWTLDRQQVVLARSSK
jgi:hypothetical protein